MKNKSTSQSVDIDFLPLHYREEFAKRRGNSLRLVVAGMFVLLVIAGAVQQARVERWLRNELEELRARHLEAVAVRAELARLQEEQEEAAATAELFTYLDHPWPRTQVLSALLEPLPDAIRITRCSLMREKFRRETSDSEQTASQPNTNEQPQEPRQAAARDLARLREQHDNTRLIVALSGATTDLSALHVYLSEVDRHRLVEQAELRSIEGGSGRQRAAVFHARIVIRPGFGQPDGPTEPVEKSSADTGPDRVARRMGLLPRPLSDGRPQCAPRRGFAAGSLTVATRRPKVAQRVARKPPGATPAPEQGAA